MKKLILSLIVVAVIAVALGTTGLVSAQSLNQTPMAGSVTNYGAGGRGAQGRMAGGQGSAINTQDGILHDAMIEVYAQALGISVNDLNTRLANGETMAQIAASAGLTVEQFSALMVNARTQAIAQAVQEGTLTQAQADWMLQRSNGRLANGAGTATGTGHAARGTRGTGQGQYANPDCPYYQSN